MANKNTIKIVEVNSIDVPKLRELFGKGKFASAEFVKKSDGTDRIINGKLSVKRGLAGGEATYDAESRGQLRIFDINKKDKDGKRVGRFTAVTAQNLKWVQSEGVKYVIKNDVEPTLNFVQSIIYQHVNKLLRLTLNGRVYAYFGVPKEIHLGLVNSPNKGNYFNTHIKNKFKFYEVKSRG